jgi:hypothetical protein
MNAIAVIVAVVCAASVSACSGVMTASRSGFLSSYSQLRPGVDGSSASIRSDEVIDPTRVTVGTLEWRAGSSADVSDEERRALLAELGEELVARLRALPAAPEGRPVVLRAAITRVETVSPALNAASALLFILPLDRGGAAVDVEVLDAGTGRQLAALTLGHYAPLSEFKAHFNKLAPARLALRKAASDFGALLQPAAASAHAEGHARADREEDRPWRPLRTGLRAGRHRRRGEVIE